jgi:hypothetical protein
MAKRIKEASYRSGNVELTVSDRFIYEVNLYVIYPDRVEAAGSRFYSSPKPINYKECKVIKKDKLVRVMKTVTWVSAPLDYLENNNFSLCDGQQKGRKCNSKRNKRR